MGTEGVGSKILNQEGNSEAGKLASYLRDTACPQQCRIVHGIVAGLVLVLQLSSVSSSLRTMPSYRTPRRALAADAETKELTDKRFFAERRIHGTKPPDDILAYLAEGRGEIETACLRS